MGFPGGSVVKNTPANAEDMDPSLGREDSLEKEMATLCRNLMDRGACLATVHGVRKESDGSWWKIDSLNNPFCPLF